MSPGKDGKETETMDYMAIYGRLVRKYQENPPDPKEEYCEGHHILPRSFGGTDDPNNMVALPVRVHIFCHMLLYKHWKDEAWRTMDDTAISNAGLMALALDRLHNGTERQTNVMVCFSSKLFAAAKMDGHETLKNMIWITDGKDQTMVDRRRPDAIPEGWRRGMLHKDNRHDYKWVTNGKKDIRLHKSDPIPKGFRPGRSGGKGAKGKFWINDGTTDMYVAEGYVIPKGWVRGRLSISGEKSIRKRCTKIHEFRGEKYTLTELSRLMRTTCVEFTKMMRSGMTFEQIYERLEQRRERRKPSILFRGRLFRITELERMSGINRGTIRKKLRSGMTVEQIFASYNIKNRQE